MNEDYRTFTEQLAADAARSSSALRSANPFTWLSGTWTWQGQPITFALEPYGVSRDGSPLLIFNATVRMWILAITDPGSFGILVGLGPKSDRVRFSGLVNIDGEMVELRQTWHLLDAAHIEIENEHREGSLWILWDRSSLRRAQPESGDWASPAHPNH